jgi:hypothetical protein
MLLVYNLGYYLVSILLIKFNSLSKTWQTHLHELNWIVSMTFNEVSIEQHLLYTNAGTQQS